MRTSWKRSARQWPQGRVCRQPGEAAAGKHTGLGRVEGAQWGYDTESDCCTTAVAVVGDCGAAVDVYALDLKQNIVTGGEAPISLCTCASAVWMTKGMGVCTQDSAPGSPAGARAHTCANDAEWWALFCLLFADPRVPALTVWLQGGEVLV
jgi:hypothetical protein